MEKQVEILEAMFQKTESNLNSLSQKLTCQFESNEEMKVNPAQMMQQISDVKKEYSALVQEACEIKEEQKATVDEFRKNLSDVCGLLMKLQTDTSIQAGEKPEELSRLEELLGVQLPWSPSSEPETDGTSEIVQTSEQTDTRADSPQEDTACKACEVEADAASPRDRKNAEEFMEITKAEFESVSSLIRGRVKLTEVNTVYRILWEHKKTDKDSTPLSQADMFKMGLRVSGSTGQAKLKVLRALKLLTISAKGDVTLTTSDTKRK